MNTPDKVAQALEDAFSYHSRGNLVEAARRYEAILATDPDAVDALHLLGVVRRQQGQTDEAIRLLGAALSRDADYVEAHVNLGLALSGAGRHEEALASYRRALAIDPEFGAAHFSTGALLASLGRHEEAATSYQKAAAANPGHAETHFNLGISLAAGGRGEEAIANYRRALELRPDYAGAHFSLAVALHLRGRLAEAEVCLRRVLELEPRHAAAHYNLGNALEGLGRPAEAEACYRRALEVRPDYAEAHINLGVMLKESGRLAEAEASDRHALAARPDFAQAHFNLGNVLQEQGRFAEAEAAYRRALDINPDYLDARSSLLFALNFTTGHAPAARLHEAREYGRRLAPRVAARFASWQCEWRPERLRVGLVSGDLRNHAVSHFLEGLLAQLDRARVELIGYPTHRATDEVTARMKQHFAAWKPLAGQSDEAAARLIHADGVHVLLDLSGHTARHRLPVFAWKPAPVQGSWLGYFATTGVPEMDYLLADRVGLPEAEREQFSETIWYLDTRLCFTAPRAALAVAPLPALSKGHITFGCFQNLAKVGEDVLAAWARILAALPGAQLRLQCKQLGDPAMSATFAMRCRGHGIAADQLAMHDAVDRQAYLAAHAEVDLILDTFPYPGGTTTCEALWMGVPTLTLAGNSLLARQGASLLAAAGLPQWVAASEAEYVDKAIVLSGDAPQLAALRAMLRQQVLASPLFDAARFARNFEAALWEMWRRRTQA